MIARSQYMDKIRPFIGHTEMVKVLTGLRRSGKSVMFQLIQQELLSRGIAAEAILTYNFEDIQQSEWKDALSLHTHLKTGWTICPEPNTSSSMRLRKCLNGRNASIRCA